MSRKIKYDYDCNNDSLFLYGEGRYYYDFSEELDNGIIIDFDKNQNPVAFEILDASKKFNVSKDSFQKPIFFNIEINMDEYDNVKDGIAFSFIPDNNRKDNYIKVTVEHRQHNNSNFTSNDLIKDIISEINFLVEFLKDNGFKREFINFSSIRDMFDYILNNQTLLKKHISFLTDLIDSFESIVLKMGEEDYDSQYQTFSRKFLELESYFYTEIYESSGRMNKETLDNCISLITR